MSSDRAHFLDAAARIGRRLCRDAIWSDGRCNWLGWATEPGAVQALTTYRAMGPVLYDGTAGIGLFLAWLAYFTHDKIVRATAEAALAQALTAVDALADAEEYGFYTGLSGIAWCCAEAGTVLDHEQLAAHGRAVMLRAAGIATSSQRLDLINGSAGLILVLCAAAEREAREELLAAAARHGEHLLNQAARTEQGLSWDTLSVANERHLLGFAHGASGIAAALVALANISGRKEFLEAAEQALRCERSRFGVAEGSRPDPSGFVARRRLGEHPCTLDWCHGAPGIGFARLLMHVLLPENAGILEEGEIAVSTTAEVLAPAALGVGNFSLCHGDSGNADLLVLAADLLSRPELRCIAETTANCAIERFEEAAMPWPCGVPGGAETPNLLLGLAGIGYFFLRLYDSGAVSTALLPAARTYVNGFGDSSPARKRLRTAGGIERVVPETQISAFTRFE